MKRKMNSYTLDALPPLTEVQRENLKRLNARSDNQINYDDIPKLTSKQMTEMKPAQFYRPVKKQITARVDADVLVWLKSQGKGYQSRMNAILRAAMMSASDKSNWTELGQSTEHL